MANTFITNEEFDSMVRDSLNLHYTQADHEAAKAVPRETRHIFRPQRELLADAMAEAKEFDGTRAGIQALLADGKQLEAVAPYGGIDKRIGWDTYIVTVRSHDGIVNVAGFINGPLIDADDSELR